MTHSSVRRGCLNKRRYADQADAAVHAAYRTKKGAPPLRPYRCSVCKGYHLTKQMRPADDGARAIRRAA